MSSKYHAATYSTRVTGPKKVNGDPGEGGRESYMR